MNYIPITEEIIERAKALLSYDKDTGIFRWEFPPSARVRKGMQAGRINNSGHIGICIDKIRYQAHRLAWAWERGPLVNNEEIDHVDENKINNRLSNLRLCTRSQNMMNISTRKSNKSGYKGVSFNKAMNKWEAYVSINRKKINIGYFPDVLDADNAARKAREKYHKDYAKG